MKNYKLKINGNDYNVDIKEVEGQDVKVTVNGMDYVVTVDKEMKPQKKAISAPRPQAAAPAPTQKSVAPAAAAGIFFQYISS